MRSDLYCQAGNSRRGALAIALLGFLLQPLAHAQSDDDMADAVRACRRVADLSSRLACYDRAFPPVVAPAADETAAPQAPAPRPVLRRTEPAETEAPLPAAARIVTVETPSRDTTVFHAADGRVFVREDSRTTYRWPETPFEVEVQTSLFGTSTYLKFPGRGPRVRVVVRE